MNTCNTPVFRPESETDRDIFELLVLSAACSQTPLFIGEIHTDPVLHDVWCGEGRMRAEMNARRKGADWKGFVQKIPGTKLTVDEIGRLGEGPVELMLGLDVAAVVEGTDDRPDKVIDGVKFDVKASLERPENTFSLPVWQVESKDYDALLLVQHVEPGRVRVWCGACDKKSPAWQMRPGAMSRGKRKGPFYLITCPGGEALAVA